VISTSSRGGAGSRVALSSLWAVLIYVFLFAPIVLLVVFSFNANRYGTFRSRLDDQVYGQVFHDYQIRDALTTTIRIALEVTAVSTIVAPRRRFHSSLTTAFPQRDPDRDGPADHESPAF